jgi:hypothetical protein
MNCKTNSQKIFCKNEYSFLNYIQAGIGLSISNRYADWFFGKKCISKCYINKQNYKNCLDGNIPQCIEFMELLQKCNYKI